MTGKLGGSYERTAQAGFSYVRSKVQDLNIERIFMKNMIYIFMSLKELSLKMDPSAGITIATAIASALSKRKIRKDVAMTGEITLRGRVLPVGGIKEKVLFAHRAGSKIIILPRAKDWGHPQNIRRKLEFVLVEHMDEVLEKALVEEK